MHKGTKRLVADGLVLRRFTADDTMAVFEGWMGDPLVARYLPWTAHADISVTRSMLEVWIEQYEDDTYYNWGIEMGGALVGGIMVTDLSIKNMCAEVGYCLSHAHWGRGIATAAVREVMRYLFCDIELYRIYMKFDPENAASGRVMQKNGMIHEGTMRKHYMRKDGTFGDLAIYGILRPEWEHFAQCERINGSHKNHNTARDA